MKISFAQSVLSQRRWYPILDVVLMAVEDGKHSIAIDNITEILGSGWISERGSDTRDLIRLSATSRSLDPLLDRRTMVIDSNARRGGHAAGNRVTIVHPLDTIIFLSTPSQVIVENEWFDGAFMLWMAKGLGFTQLLHAYHANRFVFRHAGGKDSIVRSAKTFSESVWPRPNQSTYRAFRDWMCVVLDSDARDPDDYPNRGIIEEVQPYVSFVHQLQQRSIESYLSQASLHTHDTSGLFRQRVAALCRLSVEQRRHYHMKRGFRFSKDVEPSKANFLSSSLVTSGQKKLYAGVTENDWQLLRYGFGAGLSGIFVDPDRRPNTNQMGLVSTEARAELMNLFRSIYENT